MPYIDKQSREKYIPKVKELAELIKNEDKELTAGSINYFVSLLLDQVYGKTPRYYQHNEVIGVLECIKQEFYRRRTAPYEDEKILSNGDIKTDAD